MQLNSTIVNYDNKKNESKASCAHVSISSWLSWRRGSSIDWEERKGKERKGKELYLIAKCSSA